MIVADTQAIFRAGLRKMFALEDDIRVVGQAETLAQALSAAKKFSADVMILRLHCRRIRSKRSPICCGRLRDCGLWW